MKKLVSLILSAILSASLCLSMTGCDLSALTTGTGKALNRYTYEDGVHDFTAPEVENEYIVKNGATDYVVVVPATADRRVDLAVDEFKVLFKRATNIEIATVRDNSGDPVLTNDDAKRISIGETSLVTQMDETEKKEFGYDQSVLGFDGVRIITKNNTVYLLGGTSYGVLNAVYDFMQICFDYEFYYRNCIEMNTNVKNLKLRAFDVTDIPDIQTRIRGNNVALHKEGWDFELESGVVDSTDIERAMYRYRYIDTTEIYLPIYKEFGGREYSYGAHNIAYYVHPNNTTGEWRSTWKSDAAPNDFQYGEICYTAHGNEEDLNALVDACVDKIIYSLEMEGWNDRTYVGFTTMDGGYQCTCESCQEAWEADGNSYAGAIIRVANRIMEKVKAWMADNGQGDRTLNMFFFAYGPTEPAPVVFDEETQEYKPANESVRCRDDVYAWICTHNVSRSIYWAKEGEDAQDLAELVKWRAVTEHVFNWFYQQRYVNYSMYFDTISMLNNDMYAYAILNGAAHVINQGDYRGETVTGYGLLNEYVFSKMMWDCTLKVEDLVKKFFKAMYKDASDTMYEIFMYERAHSMTVSQSAGEYNYSLPKSASLYPYKSHLLPIIEKYEKALSEIEILKKTSPQEYELVRQRINTEYVSPLYLTLSLYGSSASRPYTNAKKLEYKAKLIEISSTMYFLVRESEPIGTNMLDFAKGV